MTGAERGRRFRARQRGEDVPKLRPGWKTDHLDKAIEALLSAVDHSIGCRSVILRSYRNDEALRRADTG